MALVATLFGALIVTLVGTPIVDLMVTLEVTKASIFGNRERPQKRGEPRCGPGGAVHNILGPSVWVLVKGEGFTA